MIFGIDGGGTRARIRILDTKKENILASLEGEGTNVHALGYERAGKNLLDLLKKGCKLAHISPTEIRSGCIGSAGLDRSEEKTYFQNLLSPVFSKDCALTLTNDGIILLVGGLGAFEGYCLIAGTGSIALGQRADLSSIRSGGLGHMLGDEGSAVWIATEAMKRTLRSIEGRDLPTTMKDALLKHFSLQQMSDFITLAHQHFDKAKIASFAPLVTTYAQSDDPLARSILQEGSNELCLLLGSVHRRLALPHPRVVFAGGVLEHDSYILSLLTEKLATQYPEISIVPRSGSALDGACAIAQRSLKQQKEHPLQ